MNNAALVILSGGQDSTTTLFLARNVFDELHAITFDYDQRHSREIEAAKSVAELADVTSHEIVRMGPILRGSSPLTNSKEDLEQYQSYEQMDKVIGDRVEKTFVPMRNTLFLTIAMNRAYVLGVRNLVTGVCQADNANYPDCREAFIRAFQFTANHSLGLYDRAGLHSSENGFYIWTPLMNNSKAETVRLAAGDPLAWEALAYSHTAYDGAYPPTGSDHATVLRAQGFLEAGLPDPLIVRSWTEGLIDLPGTSNYVDNPILKDGKYDRSSVDTPEKLAALLESIRTAAV